MTSMLDRWTQWRSYLDDNPVALFVSCLTLTVLVTVAILFFSAFGGETAAVIYQDF